MKVTKRPFWKNLATIVMVMIMEERKESAEVCIADPGIDMPENTEYIATVLRQ